MTHKERLKDIDTCLQKAISDCAQGKISAKEFADICALLRKVENEPSISTHEAAKSSQQPSIEETYPIEDDNGFLVRVPADKLDSWTAADHDAPLTPAEEQFVENLLESLYHKTVVKDKPSVTEPKASGGFNQSKAPLPPEQDRTVEKPIGCIPNSSYVPIPWYRNTKILNCRGFNLLRHICCCAGAPGSNGCRQFSSRRQLGALPGCNHHTAACCLTCPDLIQPNSASNQWKPLL